MSHISDYIHCFYLSFLGAKSPNHDHFRTTRCVEMIENQPNKHLNFLPSWELSLCLPHTEVQTNGLRNVYWEIAACCRHVTFSPVEPVTISQPFFFSFEVSSNMATLSLTSITSSYSTSGQITFCNQIQGTHVIKVPWLATSQINNSMSVSWAAVCTTRLMCLICFYKHDIYAKLSGFQK